MEFDAGDVFVDETHRLPLQQTQEYDMKQDVSRKAPCMVNLDLLTVFAKVPEQHISPANDPVPVFGIS